MRLYIMRHGVAEDPPPGGRDWDRSLTPEGAAEMEAAGRGLALMDLRLDDLLTSPRPRAEQTARLVARALGREAELRIEPGLDCGFGPRQLEPILADRTGRRVLIWGHEPDLSGLIRFLTGGRVRMKKGALVCVEVGRLESGGGELRWMLLAEHLAGLGA